MVSNHPYRTVAVALLVALAAMSAMPAVAAGEETTEITECTTIDEPGHYEIVNNIENPDTSFPCIVITSDDVTLDGNGFTIQESQDPTPDADGIVVDAPHEHKVEIKNVEVTGFDQGIRIDAGKVILHNVDVNNNDEEGIFSDGAEKVKIRDSFVQDNGAEGIELNDVEKSLVEETVVSGNGADGIDIERGETELYDNRVTNNNAEGIDLEDVQDSVVENNVINDNGGEGLELESEEMIAALNDVKVKGNEIIGNDDNGIDIDGVGESIDTKIIHNNVRNNEEDGLDAKRVKDLKVDDNTFLDNDDDQIDIEDSIKVVIGDNDIGL